MEWAENVVRFVPDWRLGQVDVQYSIVVRWAHLFCFAFLLVFLFVFFLRYSTGESGTSPAPVLRLGSY